MTELYQHQKEAVDHILKLNGNGALFMEVGTGKTLTALTLYKALGVKTMLVVCPISLIHAAWGEDIKRFTDYTYHSFRDSQLKTADIYLINFESYYRTKTQGLIRDIKPDMIVIDESSKMKNPKSNITKALLADRSKYQYKIVMSGTPAPNSETEYWPQIKFVSDLVPESFFKFRNTYFHLSRGNETMSGFMPRQALQQAFRTGFSYKTTDEKRRLLLQSINPCIYSVKKKDCLDLPDQVDEIRSVELSKPQMAVYQDIRRHMVAEIGSKTVAVNLALTKYLKLRQITSGFVIDDQGEAIDLQDNSKTKELLHILEEVGDKQVIIWLNFHAEFNNLMKVLKNYTTLYSLTKDKEESIEGFKSGKYQYLLAHPRSGGVGLTFTNCDTCIYYSIDYSFESNSQSRGRVHRPGQKNKCTYIYLLAKDTIDYEIKHALEHKQGLQEFFDDNIKKR